MTSCGSPVPRWEGSSHRTPAKEQTQTQWTRVSGGGGEPGEGGAQAGLQPSGFVDASHRSRARVAQEQADDGAHVSAHESLTAAQTKERLPVVPSPHSPACSPPSPKTGKELEFTRRAEKERKNQKPSSARVDWPAWNEGPAQSTLLLHPLQAFHRLQGRRKAWRRAAAARTLGFQTRDRKKKNESRVRVHSVSVVFLETRLGVGGVCWDWFSPARDEKCFCSGTI